MPDLTFCEIETVANEAYDAALQTARSVSQAISPDVRDSLECGVMGLILDIDGRSPLAKRLMGVGSVTIGMTVSPRYWDEGGGMSVHFHTSRERNMQALPIQEIAMMSALGVFKDKLGIEGRTALFGT